MTKSLTILHLSDLHWSPMQSKDLSIVIAALIDDLKLLQAQGVRPDLMIFSGDLVLGADDINWFQGAYDSFIIPVSNAIGLSLESVFIAPGNHDMAREEVRKIPTIDGGMKENLKSLDAINKFIDTPYKDGDEKSLLLKRVENFYTSHDCYHSNAISSSPYLRTFKKNFNGYEVGIACLNSAWRATGEGDDADLRRLIIGERVLDQAVADLCDSDFRIAVHHHPLDWLVPVDRQTSDFLIRRSFHLSCLGHVHTSRPSMSQDAAGTCLTSQTGSVFAGREWFNGYQIVEIDIPSRRYDFIVREYVAKDRRFDAATRVCPQGSVTLYQASDPRGSRRIDQVELFMRAHRDAIREAAAEQFNFFGEENLDAEQIISQFVPPPIVERDVDAVDSDSASAKKIVETDLSEVISGNSNVVFLGDRQSGKSGLCFYIAHRLATEHYSLPSIPVYIDYNHYKKNSYGIRKAIGSFYGPAPSGFNLDEAVNGGLFTFLVDNVPAEESELASLSNHISQFKECRWILFGSPDNDGVSPDRMFRQQLPSFSKFHIREMTRGGIRTLTKNRYQNNAGEAKEAFNTVMKQLIRDGLPRTPYMVSLLLWAMDQKKNLQKINEAMLLSNIVDHLLGKADFRQTKLGSLNPVGKEITLQNLAKFLFDKNGIADENEVTSFLIEFFSKKKLNFIGGDVLQKLIDCGVLKRASDQISFKYSCFQEYFLACLLRNDQKLFNYYLKDLNFLHIRREIELLAGLRQQNEDIILSISEVLARRVPTRFKQCAEGRFTTIMSATLRLGITKAELGKVKRTRLTDEQLDEMMDEADRRAMGRGEQPVSESLERSGGDIVEAAKEREATAIQADLALMQDPIKPATHMAAIDTLARVIRNSDFTDYETKGPATQTVIKSWIKIYILIIEEMEEILKGIGDQSGEPLDQNELETIKYIMSKFMFNVIGGAVIAHMSSPSMADTLHTLLEDESLPTGERLLMLFLLEDSDDSSWQTLWSDIIKDKSTPAFVLDCFIGRLFAVSHSKSLDDDQDKRVKKVVADIERRLDWENSQKSAVFQGMRETAALAALKAG